MTKEFKEWLETRPESIKKLANKYPPGDYIIKEGAPYAISCQGTTVSLYSYLESGYVTVVVLAENKLPKAIEHENELCEQYGKNKEQVHASNVKVQIDPVWLIRK